MPNKTKTPADRIKEYGSEFLIIKKNELFCKLCNQLLDHSRKSTLEQHFRSKSHVKNIERKRLRENLSQETLNNGFNSIKKDFAQDLVKAFTEANIPIYKLEHKSLRGLFDRYLLEGISIPSRSLVRKQLLVLYENMCLKLKNSFKIKK